MCYFVNFVDFSVEKENAVVLHELANFRSVVS